MIKGWLLIAIIKDFQVDTKNYLSKFLIVLNVFGVMFLDAKLG